MHTRLLSRADAYRLSIHNIADRVGLCKFECDPCDEHIAHGGFGKFLALGNDIRCLAFARGPLTRFGVDVTFLAAAEMARSGRFARARGA